MRNMERPPLEFMATDRPADDVETLVRAFFRSEVPSPWPELSLPVAEPSARPRNRGQWQRRLLLAACVAFLFLTTLSLSGSFREKDGPAARSLHGATATRRFPVPDFPELRGKAKARDEAKEQPTAPNR